MLGTSGCSSPSLARWYHQADARPTHRDPNRLTYMRPTHTRYSLITATLITCLALPHATAAQNADDFPQPITTRQLAVHADRLSMSDQQRIAIQTPHDQYLQEFDRLQREHIQPFVDEYNDIRRVALTASADLSKALRGLQSIMSTIEMLDDQLFANIDDLLTDEQSQMLPRVRLMRQRERHMELLTSMGDGMRVGARIDLTEIFNDMDTTPEQRDALDGTFMQYEQQLTMRIRQQYDHVLDSFRTLVRELDAAGLRGNIDFSDRDERRRAIRVYQQVTGTQRTVIMQGAADVSKFNRRSARDIALVMPEQLGRTFTDRYRQRAYPMAIGKSSYIDNRLRESAMLDWISGEQRDAILGLIDRTRALREPVIEQIIDIVEQQYAQGELIHNSRARRGYISDAQRLAWKLAADISDINANAIGTLDQILGTANNDARVNEKKPRAIDTESGSYEIVRSTTNDGRQVDTAVRIPKEGSGLGGRFTDAFLAAPMNRTQIMHITQALRFRADQQMIVDALYDDYLASFQTINDEINQPLIENQQARWEIDGDNKRRLSPTESMVNDRYQLRRTGKEAVLTADAQFFSDLALLTGDEAASHLVDMLHLARKRHIHAVRGVSAIDRRWRRGRGDNPREWQIDLAQIAIDVNLPLLEQPRVVEHLLGYQRTALPLLEEYHTTSMTARESIDRTDARKKPEMSRDERRQIDRDTWERLSQLSEQLKKIAQQLGTLNVHARDAIIETLGDDPIAYDFLDAYNRLAFPDVYADDRSVLGAFNTARALPDLPAPQQSSIRELAGEYRSAYHALCEQMIDVNRSFEPQLLAEMNRGAQRRLSAKRSDELDRLRFQRDELSDKMRQRLRVLLNEDQLARVRGLDLTP